LAPPENARESPRDSAADRFYAGVMLPEKDPRPTAPPVVSPNPPGTPALPSDAVEKLSPEEQMARYEESLKESDWGHQPC